MRIHAQVSTTTLLPPMSTTSTSPSSPFDGRISPTIVCLAVLVSAAMSSVFVVASAHATQLAPVITAFLPSMLGMMFMLDMVTCVLLIGQFTASRRLSYLVLAAVYAYTSLMVLLYTLTFPGIVTTTGMFGASPQTSVWLWAAWHGGFPLGIIIQAVFRRLVKDQVLRRESAVMAAVVAAALVSGVAAMVGCAAVRWTSVLPVLFRAGEYGALWTSGVGPIVLGINLVALVSLVWSLGRPTVIQLWVGVATVASFLDATLTIHAAGRFTVGWYVSQLISLFASAVVLVSLLSEMIRMYCQQAAQQEQIRHMAYHDALTGLPNRRSFSEHLNTQLSQAQQGLTALLVFDLDGFKAVNDTYGHETGDKLLVEVATRLQSSVRKGDTVARFGGDEFLVLLQSSKNYADVEAIAQRILTILADPMVIDTHQIHVAASAGIAVYPNAGNTPLYLLRNADTALYRAKRHGRNRFEFY